MLREELARLRRAQGLRSVDEDRQHLRRLREHVRQVGPAGSGVLGRTDALHEDPSIVPAYLSDEILRERLDDHAVRREECPDELDALLDRKNREVCLPRIGARDDENAVEERETRSDARDVAVVGRVETSEEDTTGHFRNLAEQLGSSLSGMSLQFVQLHEATEESRFGGKAAQLGRAIAAGLPVPRGWALDHVSVAAFAGGGVDAASEVARLVEDLGGLVAVRSSGVGEDGANFSFAGQHLTVLGLTSTTAVADAVRAVFESGREAGASAYRSKHGMAPEPRIGVVVQALVRADVAGVLFSQNPITKADERVIEATWGLGEAVVQGLVTPDSYRMKRGGEILEQTPGDKDLAIRWDGAGATEEVPVEASQVSTLCLTPPMLAALDELASKCEAVFGGTQDLEFAFVGSELFLLQRRPITTSAR